MVAKRCSRVVHSLLLLLISLPGGQQTSAARTAAESQGSPEHRLPRYFLQDQKTIWTSPAHIRKHDLKWLLPFVAAGAGLVATDRHNSATLSGGSDDLALSHTVANAGLGIMVGAFGASYISGHLRHANRFVETGVLGAEAMADSALVDNVLKLATNRRRPDTPGADGDFWSGGKAFPSSHSTMAWAAAAVFAERYPNRPLLRWAGYAMAGSVTFTRVTGKNHYPSDVFVGAVFGYLIGRYVARRHGTPASGPVR